MLFRQLLLYALLIGAVSGLVFTVAQSWLTVPIILSAETFEGTSEPSAVASAGHDHHAADEWAPDDGLERTAYTLLSNVMTSMGLALLMLAAMLISLHNKEGDQARLDWRHGLLWGLAGYVTFFVAPALGLPPEIPLVATAPLEARQLWWILTVLCTAAGLAGLAFAPSPWRWLAPVLLVVPHLVGAPHPPGALFADQVPAVANELELLARQFIGATAIANGALWLVLGMTSYLAVNRLGVSMDSGQAGGNKDTFPVD